MLLNNRVIFKDNATLLDKSVDLSNVFSGSVSLPIVYTEDALYFGSNLPFNHRYIQIGTANSVASAISVSIWNGTAFVPAVDVLDQTNGFFNSGILSWSKDKNEVWSEEETSESIADLSTLKIYDMFWVKLTFSASMHASTTLKYVGHKFSDDLDLAGYYPDLTQSSTLSAFSSGKTDWIEQHVVAAEEIILDLRKKKTIWSANQIMDWTLFNQASIHKTAEIIMRGFGEDFKNSREESIKQYHKAISGLDFGIDKDEDGKLDEGENMRTSGLFRR